MQPTAVYFSEVYDAAGNMTYPNESLKFTRSHHFILAYDRLLNENLRLKTECYYQFLQHVPVGTVNPSASLVNFGSGDEIFNGEIYSNAGRGRNYGVELTFERFFNNGYYYLLTGSFFDARYRDGKNIWRNSRYNLHYAYNVLAGKEFRLWDKHTFGINMTMTGIGGQWFTPVDFEASQAARQTIRTDSLAYTEQIKDFRRLDIKIRFRLNHRKFSQEIALDIGNITDRKNIWRQYYDPDTNSLKYAYLLGRIPVFLYKVEF